MAIRSVLSSVLLVGGVWLANDAVAASRSSSADEARQPTQASVISRISEVDACNQGQYRIPERSVLQGFRYSMTTDQQGALFHCTVSWSNDSTATPSGRPILFPNPVRIPLIWSGWF